MKFTIFLQFPTYCICHSASSTTTNNNNFLSVYNGRHSHTFLRSRIIFAPSTAPAIGSACGGQSEDPLTGWCVPYFTYHNHTYAFPCAGLFVHWPRPPPWLIGGFGSHTESGSTLRWIPASQMLIVLYVRAFFWQRSGFLDNFILVGLFTAVTAVFPKESRRCACLLGFSVGSVYPTRHRLSGTLWGVAAPTKCDSSVVNVHSICTCTISGSSLWVRWQLHFSSLPLLFCSSLEQLEVNAW